MASMSSIGLMGLCLFYGFFHTEVAKVKKWGVKKNGCTEFNMDQSAAGASRRSVPSTASTIWITSGVFLHQ